MLCFPPRRIRSSYTMCLSTTSQGCHDCDSVSRDLYCIFEEKFQEWNIYTVFILKRMVPLGMTPVLSQSIPLRDYIALYYKLSSIVASRVVSPSVAIFYFIKVPPRYDFHQFILVIIHAICKADSLLRVIHLLDIFLDLKSCRFCYRLPLSCKPARKQIVSPCRFPIRVNLKVVIHDRTGPEAQAVRREAQRLHRGGSLEYCIQPMA